MFGLHIHLFSFQCVVESGTDDWQVVVAGERMARGTGPLVVVVVGVAAVVAEESVGSQVVSDLADSLHSFFPQLLDSGIP